MFTPVMLPPGRPMLDDEAGLHRIVADVEHDGNRRGGGLGGERRIFTAAGDDDGDPPANEIGREGPAAGRNCLRPSGIPSARSPSRTGFLQPLTESSHEMRHRAGRRDCKKPITGIACSAPARRAAAPPAPPSRLMNSRRCIGPRSYPSARGSTARCRQAPRPSPARGATARRRDAGGSRRRRGCRPSRRSSGSFRRPWRTTRSPAPGR